MSRLPEKVRIVEVGPRDGLQNEPQQIATETKLELIHRLAATGLKDIEATSFVSPKWIPQMADAAQVLAQLDLNSEINYPVLTPNMKGLERALECGATQVAVFGAASESFSQKNINCSIEESLERFRPVVSRALENNVKVRGYVSCVLGCPYEGDIAPDQVLKVSNALLEMGCYEISLGDTIGVGTAASTQQLLDVMCQAINVEQLAGHFHNTYGQALTNIYTALGYGVATFDASVAGLGGCPYAPGASGNVATEDVLYLLHGLGIETGIELDKLAAVGHFISTLLQRENRSAVGNATTSKQVD